MSHYNVLVSIPVHALSEPVSKETIEQITLEHKVFQFITARLSSEETPDFDNSPFEIDEREAAIDAYIEAIMQPFSETDSKYQEFISVEEEERERYEAGTDDCVRLPSGIICTQHDYRFSRKFVVIDGKVYQRDFGQLKCNKRTKKAKRITVLPNYPRTTQYKTFYDYMNACGYEYDDEHGEYGYTTNPNGRWDWYQIGGRWPYSFLVKDSTVTFITGELSWAAEKQPPSSPEGYRWVAGARKGDIEWELMKSQRIENETARFSMMEEWFKNGVVPEDCSHHFLKAEGIENFYEVFYVKDETLTEYLARKGLLPEEKPIPDTYAFIHNNEWVSRDEIGYWKADRDVKVEANWRQMVKEYLDSLSDDDILVSVDCHI